MVCFLLLMFSRSCSGRKSLCSLFLSTLVMPSKKPVRELSSPRPSGSGLGYGKSTLKIFMHASLGLTPLIYSMRSSRLRTYSIQEPVYRYGFFW